MGNRKSRTPPGTPAGTPAPDVPNVVAFEVDEPPADPLLAEFRDALAIHRRRFERIPFDEALREFLIHERHILGCIQRRVTQVELRERSNLT